MMGLAPTRCLCWIRRRSLQPARRKHPSRCRRLWMGCDLSESQPRAPGWSARRLHPSRYERDSETSAHLVSYQHELRIICARDLGLSREYRRRRNRDVR